MGLNFDRLIIAPTSPGEAVCSRYAIAAHALDRSVAVVIKPELAPLLRGLPNCTIVHRPMLGEPAQVNVYLAELRATCQSAGARIVVDLDGKPVLASRLHCLGLKRIGTVNAPREACWYDDAIRWSYGPQDRTHYAVRLARTAQGYEKTNVFVQGAWSESRFDLALQADRRAALCPGSGQFGAGKRWAVWCWREVASFLRCSGWQVTWFLGPDESELREPLVEVSDSVCGGGTWTDVIHGHASCVLGISNDTCHLHIRAFLRRKTCVVFFRGEVMEWSSYPESVAVVDGALEGGHALALRRVKDWLKQTGTLA